MHDNLGSARTVALAPEQLVHEWTAQAAQYDVDGHPGAKLLARCARELASSLLSRGEGVITVTEAVQLTGYSADHLYRLVREGRIANLGTPKRLKVRLAELPRKAGHAGPLRRFPVPG